MELLLESYLQEVGATVAELEVLTYGIEGTEKFVSFRLDSARNRLLKIDVIATAISMTMGIGAVVTGVFGMNLKFPQYIHREDDEHPGVAFNQARAPPPPPAVATAPAVQRNPEPHPAPPPRGRRRWRRSAACSSSSS